MASGSLLLAGPAATKALQSSNYTLSSDSTTVATITSTLGAAAPDGVRNGNKISVGAVAGVGLGVGVPLLVALLTSLFFLRREHRKAKQLQERRPPILTDKARQEDLKQATTKMDSLLYPQYELDRTGCQRVELDNTSRQRAELL